MNNRKRGLSPVIATVLLVVIVIVLAIIIFIWAKSFIEERAQKQGEAVELACERVEFDAEASSTDGTIDLINRGSVAIYGIEIRKKDEGSIEFLDTFEESIGPGETGEIDSFDFEGFDLSSGDTIIVVPIILGEVDDFKKPYTCDEKFGEEIVVG